MPQITSVTATEPASTASTGVLASSSSWGEPPESSTSNGSSGTILDVGGDSDLGIDKPIGCGGKIDFLFLISRHGFMSETPDDKPWLGTPQERLVEAFPKFFQTIQSKFVDFDYQIMVVDGDRYWGVPSCDEDCLSPKCAMIDGYPCDQVDQVTECDRTLGAGVVFNAGWDAENKPCDLLDGRRYLVKSDPSPEETFACLTHVGTGGYDYLNDALMAAMSSTLNGPGGCNEGFIRDDALLMVTFIQNTGDFDSEGDVWDWFKSVRVAKHEDLNAVVMFAITKAEDLEACETQKPELNRTCELIRKFPYRDHENIWEADYGPGFARATDLLVTACTDFIPH